jgi:hypothetical protein
VLGDGERARFFGKEIGFWGETRYARISGVIWIAQGEIRDTLAHAQPRAKWGGAVGLLGAVGPSLFPQKAGFMATKKGEQKK